MSELTHFNDQGRAKMVDISNKSVTVRQATAKTSVLINEEVFQKITDREVDKGDVLSVAQVAGIMAAKNTSQWIPMCHQLQLSGVDIAFYWTRNADKHELHIEVTVKTKGSTGVEMEALTAATATALTVYDMCKAIDKQIIINQTYLLKKTGGTSGDYHRHQLNEGE